jgi:polyisoprenyl-teichoic acid--peptidoglycan teichoic acid transferase
MRRIASAFVAVLVALSGVAGIVALDARRDHDAAEITITAVPPFGPATASYEPGTWNGTIFGLVLGSDERPGLDGARADALHVVGLNPSQGRATILNIPRDTWVDVPGRGQRRVNEAYHLGGPELQAETLRRLTGAPISFVVTTTFVGLERMVDDLGGLDVDVPYFMDDQNSGAAFHAGVQHMTGRQVLSFSRNRHIPDGDLVRTGHQGQVIVHALASLRQKGTSGSEVLRYLDVLYRNVRTVGMGPVDLYRIGRAALAIDPGNVRNFTMPARIGMKGRASVVFVGPGGGGVFADFADDGVLQGH